MNGESQLKGRSNLVCNTTRISITWVGPFYNNDKPINTTGCIKEGVWLETRRLPHIDSISTVPKAMQNSSSTITTPLAKGRIPHAPVMEHNCSGDGAVTSSPNKQFKFLRTREGPDPIPRGKGCYILLTNLRESQWQPSLAV